MNFFQLAKSGMEVFENLENCCSNTQFLHEIAFFHLELVLEFLCRYSINLGSISSIYKRINRDTVRSRVQRINKIFTEK